MNDKGRSNAFTSDWLRSRLSQPNLISPVVEECASESLISAAVLIPVVDHPQGLTVLLTQRTAHLHNHPGQISFPGGRAENEDETPVATALRETEEEIGLNAQNIEVLDILPEYKTGTGFRITPVLGLVKTPFALKLHAFEVDEAFEVPLNFLLNPLNRQQHTVEIQGRLRTYYAMPYEKYFIWGATAGMLVCLHHRLQGA